MADIIINNFQFGFKLWLELKVTDFPSEKIRENSQFMTKSGLC